MFTQFDSISNMGGVVAAWFVPVSDIEKFDKLPGSHEFSVTLIEGAEWTPLHVSPNPEVGEDQSEEDAGELYTPYLKFKYPIITPAISHQQRLLLGKRLVVKVKTSNDHILYIGSPEFPAKYSYRKLVGGVASSFAGYEAAFMAVQTTSMLFESATPLLPGTIVLSSIRFAHPLWYIRLTNVALASGGSGNLTYQWQFEVDNSGIWLDSPYAFDPLYLSPDEVAVSDTYPLHYRRKVFDGYTGTAKYSNVVNIPFEPE